MRVIFRVNVCTLFNEPLNQFCIAAMSGVMQTNASADVFSVNVRSQFNKRFYSVQIALQRSIMQNVGASIVSGFTCIREIKFSALKHLLKTFSAIAADKPLRQRLIIRLLRCITDESCASQENNENAQQKFSIIHNENSGK